ncbi:hypothetical protein CW684_11325 [Macrococcoides caseolyticum]|uniref:hypothetical protein n=1 Tax=Macrococcoides caseolyticum TaxID=69966 RepID=UPI000C34196F|nr:hypothetical protein [Macrococcus caseolyticus]PKE63315.1 hypothetical protein CW683_06335 [Macrococcus caseolyticus]PKF20350.1 hypothetical protein CW684_11325 [Macrococcus caseolyticus]PKF32285.1 hypothetical protein CW687_11425 [Macrococcus caseolyticus]PKF45514.1 hypothetical protein CW664_05715 [Macrococcus caseolyticus]
MIKRSKSEDINIIRSQFEMYSNEKNEILHVAPFYINEKGNKYSVIAEGISGSSERIKESPKYVFFTQPIDNHVYDFIISKEKKYLPRTDSKLQLQVSHPDKSSSYRILGIHSVCSP